MEQYFEVKDNGNIDVLCINSLKRKNKIIPRKFYRLF